MYIYRYCLLAIPYWLFPIGCSSSNKLHSDKLTETTTGQPQGNMMPYMGPYLIPVLVHVQYFLIFMKNYGLVTPTTVYG